MYSITVLKANILDKLTKIVKKEDIYPKYLILSESQYNLLKSDNSIYQEPRDLLNDTTVVDKFMGLEILISQKVSYINDIVIY